MGLKAICDPLSKNATNLRLHFITSLLSGGKTNGLFKFQCFLVNAFGVLVIDTKKSKTIYLYSAYMENILQLLI